jgi:hypothetical protein
MKILDIDNEIKHYEQKLSKIRDEYKNSMICEWNAIREKELYFIRNIYNLNNIKEERELENKYFKTPVVIKKYEVELKNKNKGNNNIEEVVHNNNVEEVVQNNSLDCAINEEEQLEINQQFLLESYVEEEENNAESYYDIINSLGDECRHQLLLLKSERSLLHCLRAYLLASFMIICWIAFKVKHSIIVFYYCLDSWTIRCLQ